MHQQTEKILILTPVKDAADCLDDYFRGLFSLTYPQHNISVGFLESDSADGTYQLLDGRLPQLRERFRRVNLWKRDFEFRLMPGVPRYARHLQLKRRTILAKSRNQLLFRALEDEDWVLWLDVDVIEYPPDIIETLLATGKQIVHPNCVLQYGGSSFDHNAWRDQGRLHLDDLKGEGEMVKLDAVGGTMLLVKADVHRDGLIFPPFPYGRPNQLIRTNNDWLGELETEGLGIMAHDMGVECWGMPLLEIKHRNQ